MVSQVNCSEIRLPHLNFHDLMNHIMKLDRCTLLLVERAPIEFGEPNLAGSGCGGAKRSIRAKTSIERGVNATDHRCEW